MAFIEGEPTQNQEALDEFIRHGKTGQIFDAEKGILVQHWVDPNPRTEIEEITRQDNTTQAPEKVPLLRRLIASSSRI